MIFNLSGAGNTRLNFSVAGSLTEPETPAENTIWVMTDAEISSYRFDGAEPVLPEEGMVWIRTGASGDVRLNALKTEEICLYPIQAAVYVNDAWIPVDARIRQNGEWIAWWDGLLYTAGDECTNMTGGWIAEAVPRTSGGDSSKRTVTRGETELSVAAATSKGGIVRTSSKINLTGQTELVFEGTLHNPSSISAEFWCSICLWSEIGATFQENVAAAFHSVYGETEGQQTLDISQVPAGAYYVGFALYGTATVSMTKMQVR